MMQEAVASHFLILGAWLAVVGIWIDADAATGNEDACHLDVLGFHEADEVLHDDIEAEKKEGSPYPTTFVPGRNLFFLSVAAIYARNHGVYDIITGVGQADFSGYPDCRDGFIKSLNTTLNLAMDEQFRLHTPLMWLDKQQTWALADELGVLDTIRYRTLTCYNGIVGDGCGHCPSCKLRREGLEKYLKTVHSS